MKTEPIPEQEPTKYRYYQNKTIIAGFKRKKEIQRAFDAYFVGEKVVFLSYSSAIFDYCDLNCCHLTACSVLLIYIPIVVLPHAPLRTYLVGFP